MSNKEKNVVSHLPLEQAAVGQSAFLKRVSWGNPGQLKLKGAQRIQIGEGAFLSQA
jgi:hypothetical protein